MSLLRNSEFALGVSALALTSLALVNCGRTAKSQDEINRATADDAASTLAAKNKAKTDLGAAPAVPAIGGTWKNDCLDVTKFSTEVAKDTSIKAVRLYVNFISDVASAGAKGTIEQNVQTFSDIDCKTKISEQVTTKGINYTLATPTGDLSTYPKKPDGILSIKSATNVSTFNFVIVNSPASKQLSMGKFDVNEAPKTVSIVLDKFAEQPVAAAK